MKIAGIIAEYNPFHNGHAYLIKKAREAGADCVAVVMSGNFVQRGDAAIFRDDIRTRAALAGGADIVIQLPCVYAVSGAANFAFSAVKILHSLGCVDMLVFGSECGNTVMLRKTAELLSGDDVQNEIAKEIKTGISFAAARENALRKFSAECADIICNPNDILAVEYISALTALKSDITPFAVKRTGALHGSDIINNNIASASAVRALISECGKWEKLVPESVYKVYSSASDEQKLTDKSKLETAILYKLRTCTTADIAVCPDVSEGIENRIFKAAKEASSLEELYSAVKTKRYSHARIRRIILNCALGITAEEAAIPVPYIRILGFGERGAQMLKAAYETASLPIITKAAELKNAGSDAEKIFAAECRAGDIYALCADKTGECSEQSKGKIIKV